MINIVNEAKVAELRIKWGAYPGYEMGGFKDVLDTLEMLWPIARAAHKWALGGGLLEAKMLEEAVKPINQEEPKP